MRSTAPSRTCGALLVAVLAAGPPAAAQAPAVISFEHVRPGTIPREFRTLSSSDSDRGTWQVERVEGVPTFSKTDKGREGYRLAVVEATRLDNVRLGTRLRMGRGERAAGLAWRVRDAGNYYAARLDLDSHEFIVYKFVRGNRVRLSRLRGLRLDTAAWHEMVVEHVGERIKVWLNGIPVATERDDALAEPGMVGLWMPGDSTAHYARLWYERVAKE